MIVKNEIITPEIKARYKRNKKIILKKNILGFFLFITFLISMSSHCFASFEQILGGARPQSMGGAFTALADNSDAIFYNPAGLTQLEKPELIGGYCKKFVGLDDNSNLYDGNIIFAYPLKKGEQRKIGSVALGFDIYSLANYYTESTIGIYYGARASKKFSFGLGLKYLSLDFGTDEYTPSNPVFDNGTNKTNASVDVGFMYHTSEKITAGLAVKDLNEPDMGLKYEDKVARKILLGLALREKRFNFTTNFDFDSKSNSKFVVGCEGKFLDDTLAVRAGLGVGNRRYSRANIGGGYTIDKVTIDYSFLYQLSGICDTYGTHKLSFGYKFGKSIDTSSKEADKFFEKALNDIRDGKYNSASENLDNAIRIRSGKSKYEETKERLELVKQYVGNNLEGKSKAISAERNGIVQYVIEDEPKEAVRMLMYALSLGPENKNLDKLIKALQKKHDVKIEDSTAKTWNLAEQKVYKALRKFKEKKYDECIKLCEEVLELDPNNVTAYKRLGSTFYILGDHKSAKYNWQKVLELSPKDDDAPQIREILKKLE